MDNIALTFNLAILLTVLVSIGVLIFKAGQFTSMVGGKLESLERRIDAHDMRLEKLEHQLTALGQQLVDFERKADQRFDSIQSELSALNKSLLEFLAKR